MANKKKGQTVPAAQWWKHLRNYWGRNFWKRQRQADKKLCSYSDSDWFLCGLCFSNIEEKRPNPGEFVMCNHCGSEAYGTYDPNGEYMIEWHPLKLKG